MIINNWDSKTNSDTYIIAEIGVNHECNLDLAYRQIKEAKEGGANAAKFQVYKADMIACKDSPAYWDQSEEECSNQFSLFKKYDSFSINDYKKLFEYCKKLDIDFMATPFDLDCVDWLSDLVPVFKIASADLTHEPLLKKVASKKLPVILSTGASNIEEIRGAIKVLELNGAKDVALLHCVLSYPCDYDSANLKIIELLQHEFPDNIIGYSDHTKPDNQMLVLTTAMQLGAQIIEKHFTHDKSLTGNDHYHSMDWKDLKLFRLNEAMISSISGVSSSVIADSELNARKFARRSIVTTRNIPSGKVFTYEDFTFKRPGIGLSPDKLESIIGKIATKDLNEDVVITNDDYC